MFRTLVGSSIQLNEGCLKPLNIIAPEWAKLNPRYPAAVITGNTEVSQASCNALYGAQRVMTFPVPVTVTTLSSHHAAPPFGMDGASWGRP